DGVDLTTDAIEVPGNDRLRFAEGDATALPFADASFDVVCAYQMLEHVPDPGAALGEFARVLRPGGFVCVVGPNLVTPISELRGLLSHVWRVRPISTIFVRRPGMPRHPSGNTLPESAVSLVQTSARLTAKLASPRPRFEMRVPDTVPPFHADNDACYLCCPVDLIRFFGGLGFSVVRSAKPGRPAFTGPIAAGTWFA